MLLESISAMLALFGFFGEVEVDEAERERLLFDRKNRRGND